MPGRPAEGGRVLVVDDEDQIRLALARALRTRGFVVENRPEGESALHTFAWLRPDLVVLDLNLPGMDGLTVCRRIREQSDVPILILSVREEEADKVEALNLGADDYLTKRSGSRSSWCASGPCFAAAAAPPARGCSTWTAWTSTSRTTRSFATDNRSG